MTAAAHAKSQAHLASPLGGGGVSASVDGGRVHDGQRRLGALDGAAAVGARRWRGDVDSRSAAHRSNAPQSHRFADPSMPGCWRQFQLCAMCTRVHSPVERAQASVTLL